MCYKHAHGRGSHGHHQHWKRGFRQAFGQQFWGKPPVNIEEKEDHFELSLFAPGLTREGFSIRVKNDRLKIAYRETDPADNDDLRMDYSYREFRQPSFERSFELNNKVLVEQISATYTDGVLKVTLPKNPETNRPVHEVEVG